MRVGNFKLNFFKFSTKMDQGLKWLKLLKPNFKLIWTNAWSKQHNNKKEVGFIWVIWNKVVMMNG